MGQVPGACHAPALWPRRKPQATHIFDGLDGWPTHVLYLGRSQPCLFGPAVQVVPGFPHHRIIHWVERHVGQGGRALLARRCLPVAA